MLPSGARMVPPCRMVPATSARVPPTENACAAELPFCSTVRVPPVSALSVPVAAESRPATIVVVCWLAGSSCAAANVRLAALSTSPLPPDRDDPRKRMSPALLKVAFAKPKAVACDVTVPLVPPVEVPPVDVPVADVPVAEVPVVESGAPKGLVPPNTTSSLKSIRPAETASTPVEACTDVVPPPLSSPPAIVIEEKFTTGAVIETVPVEVLSPTTPVVMAMLRAACSAAFPSNTTASCAVSETSPNPPASICTWLMLPIPSVASAEPAAGASETRISRGGEQGIRHVGVGQQRNRIDAQREHAACGRRAASGRLYGAVQGKAIDGRDRDAAAGTCKDHRVRDAERGSASPHPARHRCARLPRRRSPPHPPRP